MTKHNDTDPVNNPTHYTSHPSGVQCITITEHMGFNLGNALKYIWRADMKHDAIEDLKKARWYLDREISLRTAGGRVAPALPAYPAPTAHVPSDRPRAWSVPVQPVVPAPSAPSMSDYLLARMGRTR